MSVSAGKSLHALTKAVARYIDQGALDRALRSIYEFVERIITEPVCTSQVYGSRELDELCQRIGRTNLSNQGRSGGAPAREKGEPVFVYVVTRLQNSGGHARVIENFIRSRPRARHTILSTELCGRSDLEYLRDGLTRQSGVTFERAPRGNFARRLTWLQRRLAEAAPFHTYLFNHHQDSVAVAAVQPKISGIASFYHHGDHHLCLGVHLPHMEHIDPHPMGYHNCRDVLGIRNTYIPLTFDDKGARPPGQPFKGAGHLVTCTAARSNKVEIPYFVSYLDVIPSLLKATGGKHIHIGRLTPWARWRIARGLRRHQVAANRFEYIPWVGSVWKALQDRGVDLYVASFPYVGALTLIEAMGAGVPLALHNHISSRVLSGIDLAYPEAFVWKEPEELLDYCATVSADVLQQHSRSARSRYDAYHRREILEELLTSEAPAMRVPESLSSRYVPKYDEWACWAERQLSLSRLMKRAAYRSFRRLRARFS